MILIQTVHSQAELLPCSDSLSLIALKGIEDGQLVMDRGLELYVNELHILRIKHHQQNKHDVVYHPPEAHLNPFLAIP